MHAILRPLLPTVVLLTTLAPPVFSQYIRITTDNPADSTRLRTSGPTLLTIILDTNHDKDGTLQTCNSHSSASCGATPSSAALDLLTYQIYLSAVGGTVTWGTFTPDSSAFHTLQAQVQDTHDVEFTFSRQPPGSSSPPGLSSLGKIPVTIASGSPAITFPLYPNLPLDPNSFGSTFGTNCQATVFGNSYLLGDPVEPCGAAGALPGDWFDTNGVASGISESNEAPSASAPATLTLSVGEPVQLAGDFSDPDPGDSLTVTVEGYPPGLSPVNGNQVGGTKQVRLYGIPDRSIPPGQHYSIEWSVSDGESSRTATSDVHVQGAEPAPDLGSTMAKYLSAQHFDGMSRLQVRKFGTQALPILAQMLRDERYKGIWHRITGAIGFIGDTAYFDTLHAFIWDRFQGEVDYPTYMAIQNAQACLNAMATVSPRVFSYLVQTVDPAAWEDLRWSVRPYSARRIAVSMTRMSIVALGYTDSGRASAILRRLAETPYDPWQMSPVRDAIRRNDQVRSIGFTKVWESEDPPPVSLK